MTGSAALRVVALSGTLHSPSKTGRLVDAILGEFTARGSITPQRIDLIDYGHSLVNALGSGTVDQSLQEAFNSVLTADVLVIATPVYKASYTGLLKLFVDFLAQDALAEHPVLLAATGGNDLHSLVIEHELRPLFGFFGAATVPAGVYARNSDFAEPGAVSGTLSAQITVAVDQALRLAHARTSAS